MNVFFHLTGTWPEVYELIVRIELIIDGLLIYLAIIPHEVTKIHAL